MDRASRCIIAWRVVWERSEAVVQSMLDNSLKAAQYFSDLFPPYATIVYWPGQQHRGLPNKSETYTVEGVNADLRHYLARLRRKSRCFSRCIHALTRAVQLFVFAYNQRQLYKLRHPHYPAYLMDFASPTL